MSLEWPSAAIAAITPVDNGAIADTHAHFHSEEYLASHCGHVLINHAHLMEHHETRIMHNESIIPRRELEFIFKAIQICSKETGRLVFVCSLDVLSIQFITFQIMITSTSSQRVYLRSY